MREIIIFLVGGFVGVLIFAMGVQLGRLQERRKRLVSEFEMLDRLLNSLNNAIAEQEKKSSKN